MQEISLNSFDDFLDIARQQLEPAQLLLVLARKELPAGHTPEQARQYAAGEGGHLAPAASVDKAPGELPNLSALVNEAEQMLGEWDAVFVAALPGEGGKPPSAKAIDENIEKMLHAIRNGLISNFLVFDRSGKPLQLTTA